MIASRIILRLVCTPYMQCFVCVCVRGEHGKDRGYIAELYATQEFQSSIILCYFMLLIT